MNASTNGFSGRFFSYSLQTAFKRFVVRCTPRKRPFYAAKGSNKEEDFRLLFSTFLALHVSVWCVALWRGTDHQRGDFVFATKAHTFWSTVNVVQTTVWPKRFWTFRFVSMKQKNLLDHSVPALKFLWLLKFWIMKTILAVSVEKWGTPRNQDFLTIKRVSGEVCLAFPKDVCHDWFSYFFRQRERDQTNIPEPGLKGRKGSRKKLTRVDRSLSCNVWCHIPHVSTRLLCDPVT